MSANRDGADHLTEFDVIHSDRPKDMDDVNKSSVISVWSQEGTLSGEKSSSFQRIEDHESLEYLVEISLKEKMSLFENSYGRGTTMALQDRSESEALDEPGEKDSITNLENIRNEEYRNIIDEEKSVEIDDDFLVCIF